MTNRNRNEITENRSKTDFAHFQQRKLIFEENRDSHPLTA